MIAKTKELPKKSAPFYFQKSLYLMLIKEIKNNG